MKINYIVCNDEFHTSCKQKDGNSNWVGSDNCMECQHNIGYDRKQYWVDCKAGMKTITWREVLDNHETAGTDIIAFLPIVESSGYQYFNWNGRIYQSIPPMGYDDTGILISDLPATIVSNPLKKAYNAINDTHWLGFTLIGIKNRAKEIVRTLYEETKCQSKN